MPLTILADSETTVDVVDRDGRMLVPPGSFTAATGWTRKPEGMCRGPICIPVRDPQVDGADGMLDLEAAVDAINHRLVVDRDAGVAAIAGDPMSHGEVRNLHDLELPDLDGNPVHLSKLAGKKTVLIAWASW